MYSKKWDLDIDEIKSSIKDGLIATFIIMGVSYQFVINQTIEIIKTMQLSELNFLIPYGIIFIGVTLAQMFFKWVRPGDTIIDKILKQIEINRYKENKEQDPNNQQQ